MKTTRRVKGLRLKVPEVARGEGKARETWNRGKDFRVLMRQALIPLEVSKNWKNRICMNTIHNV
jgi:hypothetical protein